MVENRTTEFFNQNVADLEEALRNRILIDQTANKQVQLTRLEPYPKVGPRYRAIIAEKMQPGEIWIPYIPVRRMSQSLIIAKSIEPEVGACVRVLRGSYYDLEKGEFVPMPREGDIAKYLGLGQFERASLRFLDESEALYIIRGEHIRNSPDASAGINPDEANGELKKLLQ